MAKIYGGNSKYITKIKNKSTNLWFIVYLLLIVSFLFYIFNIPFFYTLRLQGIIMVISTTIIIFATVITLTDKFLLNYIKSRNGLNGENVVEKTLSKLPDSFKVFRGIRFLDRCDIDFLVAGPTGIFNIEVKSHRGEIKFDGKELTRNGYFFEKDILYQTINETRAIKDYVKKSLNTEIEVIPVTVFSNSKALLHFGFNLINGVTVIQEKWLLNFILNNKSKIIITNMNIIENEFEKLLKTQSEVNK